MTLDPQEIQAPRADKRPHVSHFHGFEKFDDYAWLKAANWQEVMHDPSLLPQDIRAYLEAENAYTQQAMTGTEELQQTLFAEMRGRIKEDDSTVPAPDGDFEYYLSYIEGGQHYRFMRRKRNEADPGQMVLDGNALAAGKEYFHFGSVAHSHDHRRIAWSCDDKGSEFFTIRVRDIESGEDLSDVVVNSAGNPVWLADSSGFYYAHQDENHRPLKIFLHKLGTPQSEDRLIYEEQDTGLFCSVDTLSSKRYAVISSHDHEKNETRLLDLLSPDAEPRLIAKRQDGLQYDTDHWEDRLIFKTNRDGAEDYKLMWAPLVDPAPENWRDLLPYRPGCFIVQIGLFKNWLIRMERESALPRIVVRDMRNGQEHAIAFEEEAYSLGFGEMLEYDSNTLRFTYSSPTTPLQVFDYDMESRQKVLRKTQVVPSGHDPSAYVARRLMAPAHDGEMIPITLLYRKDTPVDGSAPLWLYGYGSYGISIPAGFSTSILSLVDRGLIYAIAHIRGGQEKGRAWYKAGKLALKPNSFKDFISVAQFLVEQRFTSPQKISAHGGSAGGMLMGAVANMAPDLFGAIIADVPFVDVLTTMLDESLPLTPPEWPEWGNPIESAEAYRSIASYAPYEQVEAKAYPAILAVGGLTDPRVTYWEPAKWVARLRDRKTDQKPLLLKINMGAGHGGASGRFDHLKEVAFNYAFGLSVLGAKVAA